MDADVRACEATVYDATADDGMGGERPCKLRGREVVIYAHERYLCAKHARQFERNYVYCAKHWGWD